MSPHRDLRQAARAASPQGPQEDRRLKRTSWRRPQPIAAVAEQLGYSDAVHFSRQFREVVGCSPSRWRDG
ncbi:MAG: helix-turn-helix domain-containing protein [Planctomycetota bacterium]